MLALLLAVPCGAAPAPSFDSPGPIPEPLHPRDYASVDGAWVLHVDPSQRYGAGPALCRMTRAGELVWERQLPFTFQDARVASDGSVVGHASTTGVPLQEENGAFVIAILGPDGEPRGERRELYRWLEVGRGLTPWPLALELAEDLDRAAVRVSVGPRQDEWWVCALSTGKEVETVRERPAYLPEPLPPSESMPAVSTLDLSGVPELAAVALGSAQLGEPPSGARRSLEALQLDFRLVDARGWLWFAERCSMGVLAFDRSGRRRCSLAAASEDLGRGLVTRLPLWIAVRDDGSVLVRRYRGLVEHAPDGVRLGRTGEANYLPPQTLFVPGGRGSWEVGGYRGVLSRFDATGGLTRRIERGANERWLCSLWRPVVAGDGSLALLDHAHSGGDSWIHVFDASGSPRASLAIDAQLMAYDGRRIAVLRDEGVLVYDLGGRVTGKLTLGVPPHVQALAFSPDGELWLVTESELHRYDVR